MNYRKIFFIPTLMVFAALFLTSCEKEETSTTRVNFEITDAPIDDTNIKSVFVTVKSLSINGEVATDFAGKTSLDLLTLQNGNTKALGFSELELDTYDRISLELDYETDADGNSPGCYVLTEDDVKHPINSSSSNALTLSGLNIDAQSETSSTYVLDFDVRKAIRYDEQASNDDQYDLVTTSELEAAIRVVDKSQTLSISGNVENTLSNDDYIVAYLYKKGDFNQSEEVNGQGSSEIQFKNAITSDRVEADGDYKLSFIEGGEYELYFVKYEPTQDERLIASSFLQVNSLTSLDILGLEAEVGVDLTVNVIVTGSDPF